jgi:signal transduction histidine kinase
MSPVDVGELARETVQVLDPMAQARSVRLSYRTLGSVPLVYGDRDRLAEAIYHLAHNAIRFNRQGGSVKLTCRAELDKVILEVADTGMGIAPDKLPEIWRDFAQLADPLRRGVEGLGLGLPLVRYVIKAHGGHVWARSEPGQGSVFGFSLQATRQAA